MKKVVVPAIFFAIVLSGFACEHKPQEVYISSYEIHDQDTINRMDSKGRKQGRWMMHAGTDSAKTMHYFNGHLLTSY